MANLTRHLMGDPPPGRTPWAEPVKPSEEKRAARDLPRATAGAAPLASITLDPAQASGDARDVPETPENPAITVAPCALKDEGFCPKDESAPGAAGGMRPITPVNLFGLDPTAPTTGGPIFEWVDPSTLLVNEDYQRSISDRGLSLIRRIIENWDWTRFKPPVCSMGEDGLEVIDGQHTAIGAASHPFIEQIPVMIVETPDVGSRASAFIGHNRDRLNVTPMQMHRASVVAADPDALTVEQVCQRAGVKLLDASPKKWAEGETVAIRGIEALVSRRHAAGARRVLEILVQGGAAPVTANGIKAVEMILTDPEFAEADPEKLAAAITSSSETVDREAGILAAKHCIPLWKAMGIVWFRKCRKRKLPA